MLDLNSLGIDQLQVVKSQIDAQINTYKSILTIAKTQYNNCMDKLASAKTTLESAKDAVNNAKSNFSNTAIESPIPSDLLEIPSSSPDVAINSVETAGLQMAKINAENKISKYQEKLDKLKEWKALIDKKIQEYKDKFENLKQQAKDYVSNQIQNAENFALNQGNTITSKVTNTVSNTTKQITKTTSGLTNTVQTTIKTVPINDLTKK